MDARERLLRTFRCERTDRRPFLCEFGPWYETLLRWEQEGMTPVWNWQDGLGLDPPVEKLAVELGFCPAFEEVVLEDRGDRVLRRNRHGVVEEQMKETRPVAHPVDFPLKTREDWLRLKRERLDPEDPRRFPADFDAKAARAVAEGRATRIGKYPFGLFGTLREWMGVEGFLFACADEPEWIEEMMSDLTDLWTALYRKAAARVRIDWVHIWEDMSGRTGSLISPAMVERFMLPNYRRIRETVDEIGAVAFSVDTDGDAGELLPLFLSAGVNFVFPFEVGCGEDVLAAARRYPGLCIMGGIDKARLAHGRAAIDAELARVDALFDRPGYIPMLDHGIPPDVSLSDFHYYMRRLRERLGVSHPVPRHSADLP
jgi:uroporphyrinogen decarboxylase